MKYLMNYLESGSQKPDMEVIAATQREFEGQTKALNALVGMYAIQSKNKRAIAGMERMNIMDDTTAIDLMLSDPNTDKVKCPMFDELITRADCLDYSGSNGDDCRGCVIDRATKKKLLPETEGR
jgi:hypothetical protein